MILPAIAVITAILGYPLYRLVVLSFQQYGLAELIQRQGTWVGLDNYSSVLRDEIFWRTLLRTVIFTAANVGLTIVLGTLIAFLLVRVSSWVRLLLTAGLILVWAMPAVVAVQVWSWMTNFQNGILNHVLTELGVGDYNQHDWYATTFSKLAMVTLLIVWGAIPFVTITVYAGLAQVPRELVEAAEIDGAGPLRVFRDVTFPILKPIFLILTSLSIIWDFGVFTQPYLLIGASQVDTSNYLMGVYVFIEGYAHSDFGRGAAISLLMLLIVAALSVVLRPPDGEDGRGSPVSSVSEVTRARVAQAKPRPASIRRARRRRLRRAAWNVVGLGALRRARVPRLLDDLDGVQAGRRDQQLPADVPLRRAHAAALPRRDRAALLLGYREEQPDRGRCGRRRSRWSSRSSPPSRWRSTASPATSSSSSS